MPLDPNKLDGPIPGENYTSDTKNYPWHRPPEITDMDQAIEATLKKLTSREGVYGLLTALQGGITVAQFASIFVVNGIGAGKWTPDFAILLAGPVAHVIKILADTAGIKYEMGISDDPIPTIAFYKGIKEIDQATAESVGAQVMDQKDEIIQEAEEKAKPTGGFMGMDAPAQPEVAA